MQGLPQLLQTVSAPTAAIVQASRAGSPFGQMKQQEIMTTAELIIADLKLMTGLKIPLGKGFSQLQILTAETLAEDYPLFTYPLVKIAFKKHCSVLTTGENKSYGRDLSLADIHQVLDVYSAELHQANAEVDAVLSKQGKEMVLTEEEKQNLIRAGIEEKYQAGMFNDCTYVDFNQLFLDGIISQAPLDNRGWASIQKVKQGYIRLSEEVVTDADPQSLRGIMQKRDLKEKISLLTEIENEYKASVASAFMFHAKKKNRVSIYAKDSEE